MTNGFISKEHGLDVYNLKVPCINNFQCSVVARDSVIRNFLKLYKSGKKLHFVCVKFLHIKNGSGGFLVDYFLLVVVLYLQKMPLYLPAKFH